MELIITLLYIVFILSAIVLVVVVLLQEGRGGGLTDALGTAGQQTFGVAASGIHKFTGWTGAVFVVSALAIHMLNRQVAQGTATQFGEPAVVAPAEGGAGDAGTGGAGDGSAGGGAGGAPEQPK